MSLPRQRCSSLERLYHDTFVARPCTFAFLLDEYFRYDWEKLPRERPNIQKFYPELLRQITLYASKEDITGVCIQKFLGEMLKEALLYFSVLDCRAPRHENSLTGSLITRLSSSATKTNNSWKKIFQKHNPYSTYKPIYAWSVDLVLKGREQKLGADIAFVIETNGNIIATCLQAKRILKSKIKVSPLLSISQPNAAGNPAWQLQRLSRLEELELGVSLNPAYMFYDNDDCGSAYPVMPIVKPLRLMTYNEWKDLKVNLNLDTCDLASYMMSLVPYSDTINPEKETDIETLKAVACALVQADCQHMVCMSSTYNFGHRLQSSLECSETERVVLTEFSPASGLLDRPRPTPFHASEDINIAFENLLNNVATETATGLEIRKV